MKIRRIAAYQVDLPLAEGSYHWSGGKSVDGVRQHRRRASKPTADSSGYGEVCPLGPSYLPAYAAGVRAGIAELGPQLLGADPTRAARRSIVAWTPRSRGIPTSSRPSTWPAGTSWARSPACRSARCWADATAKTLASIAPSRSSRPRRWPPAWPTIAARATAGSNSRSAAIRTSTSLRIRAVAGVLQPGDQLVADANTGWLLHEAARVVRAVRDVDVYIEQPCLSYEECLAVRRRTDHPFVLDEVIDGVDMLLRGHADQAMDVVNLKISKFGGLTKTRQARDLCVSLGIAMTIEDTWGGDIVTAAIAHLAHSTPTRIPVHVRPTSTATSRVSIADGAPQRVDGRMAASHAPGLGIKPRLDVLGKPVLEICLTADKIAADRNRSHDARSIRLPQTSERGSMPAPPATSRWADLRSITA